MYIFGASGHGKVIKTIADESESTVVKAFVDDDPKCKSVMGVAVISSKEFSDVSKTPFVIAIGNNQTRKKIAIRLNAIYKTLMHSTSFVHTTVRIGAGTVIMPKAIVNVHAVIGEHCIVNSGAIIEHDCNVENFVHIAPKVALAGNVSVGEGTHVGIGAVVIQGIKIGKWATIGAGAVVIRDVPDHAVVVGNPGRVVKFRNEV